MVKMRGLQTVKTLTWNFGLLCKDADFPPFQPLTAIQLPCFQAIGPTPSPTTFDSTPLEVEDDIVKLEFFLVRYNSEDCRKSTILDSEIVF
jgi:hypothetical protein